jgi:hypothetical protein
MAVQTPALQTWPIPQALLHAPQFAGSLEGSTQAFPQEIWPAGHTHAPALHVWPIPQAFAHAPQFATSLVTSTHACPHFIKPAEQVAPHTPTSHT